MKYFLEIAYLNQQKKMKGYIFVQLRIRSLNKNRMNCFAIRSKEISMLNLLTSQFSSAKVLI